MVRVGSPAPVASGQAAAVLGDRHPQREQPALVVEADLDVLQLRPAVDHRDMFSLRVSTYLTGRRSRRDSSAVSRNSG